MNRPTDEVILAFLEGSLEGPERDALLDRMDADPELAAEVRRAATGMEAVQSMDFSTADAVRPVAAPGRGKVSPWWAVAASVATLLISVPATVQIVKSGVVENSPERPASGLPSTTFAGGRPSDPTDSYVLVLHGRWPDADGLRPDERQRRANEYWEWTTGLARDGVLVAAGDLQWEAGERLGPLGLPIDVPEEVVDDPDYVVGMFALRVGSYDEAVAVAAESPHLKYGGSVSVRRVGLGFVTVPGMDDWAG